MKHGPMSRVALLLFLAAGLVACGGGSTKTTPPTTGSLSVTNNASATIHEVYVSPTTSTVWGSIQNTAAIAPGTTWTLGGLAPNSYDGKAVSVGAVGRYYAYTSNLPITAGTTYPTSISNSAFSGSIRVTNGPSSSITTLYVVPAGAASWGVDQLTADIPLSGVLTLNGVASGLWDLRCVHLDGTTNSAYALSVSSLSYTGVTCL